MSASSALASRHFGAIHVYFILCQSLSIRLSSGLYGGKKKNFMPLLSRYSIIFRSAFALWIDALSSITVIGLPTCSCRRLKKPENAAPVVVSQSLALKSSPVEIIAASTLSLLPRFASMRWRLFVGVQALRFGCTCEKPASST